MYDKPVQVQKINEKTELWTTLYTLHAEVNKSGGSEYFNAGSERAKTSLTFKVRYFKGLEDVFLNTQKYRLVYRGCTFNIVDYDDFMESRREIKLLGESYGN